MSHLNIHYLPDGEIITWDNAPPAHGEAGVLGSTISTVEIRDFDPKTHKIDTATLEIVNKTDEEKAIALLPTLFEVQAKVFNELQNTDGFMAPDRPMSADKRTAWATYRQALRDLSKLPTPVDMMAAWPPKPAGK